MGRLVKCRYCGKKIDKDIAFKYDYFDSNYTIKSRFYCNQQHYETHDKEKEYTQGVYDIFANILGVKIKANIYFSKMFKEVKDNYKIDIIYKYLFENEDRLSDILNAKYFGTLNVEIKYLMVIVQKELDEFNKRYKESQITKAKEVIVAYEDEFVDFSKAIKKKEKSLEEILEELGDD